MQRRVLVFVSASCFGIFTVLPSCSSDSADTLSPVATTTTKPHVAVVTIRLDWDNRCNVSWRLEFSGTQWKAADAPASWGDRLEGLKRTGTVESSSETGLTYRDDDGTLVQFALDDSSGTVCS